MSFDSFCHEMHRRNCDERRDFNQPLLSFEEYVSKNEKFLLDIFEDVCNNQNTD